MSVEVVTVRNHVQCRRAAAVRFKMENVAQAFDKKRTKISLEKENEFISDLLISLDVPDSVQDDCLDVYLTKSKNNTKSLINHCEKSKLVEDETKERENIILNKMRSKKPKVSSRAIKKRGSKNDQKTSSKSASKINNVKFIKKEGKEDKCDPSYAGQEMKSLDPIFNEECKIVFSKFDFSSHPGGKNRKTKKDKVMKNPTELLKSIKEQKNKISQLVEKGEKEKALEIKTQLAWKKAFDKTEGKKVKDDPNLLLKAVKKKKDLKRLSKKKWAERKEKVEQSIAKSQQKRQENLNKRIKDKKVKKLKLLSKKGRVIAGF